MKTIRRLLGLTFVLGSLGTATELLLLGHIENVFQLIPLGLLAAGCLTFLATSAGDRGVSRQAFLVMLLLFVASGIAGTRLHYVGNTEFERELDPDTAGFSLFAAAMTGATPVLAPGTMMLLAAVGWAYVRLDSDISPPHRAIPSDRPGSGYL